MCLSMSSLCNRPAQAESILFLRDTLRGQSGGKGMTDIQARTSALCEALERYSGVWWRDEYVVTDSYNHLKPAAIHLNECMAFSEKQYANREKWNETTAKYHVVPQPFDEDLEAVKSAVKAWLAAQPKDGSTPDIDGTAKWCGWELRSGWDSAREADELGALLPYEVLRIRPCWAEYHK